MKKNMFRILLGNKILVKQENKNKNSVLIIDEELDFNVGEIVMIGESCEITLIKKGNKVMFKELAGERIEIDKEKYLVLNYEDIIGVL